MAALMLSVRSPDELHVTALKACSCASMPLIYVGIRGNAASAGIDLRQRIQPRQAARKRSVKTQPSSCRCSFSGRRGAAAATCARPAGAYAHCGGWCASPGASTAQVTRVKAAFEQQDGARDPDALNAAPRPESSSANPSALRSVKIRSDTMAVGIHMTTTQTRESG
jgi:hypothetical protein